VQGTHCQVGADVAGCMLQCRHKDAERERLCGRRNGRRTAKRLGDEGQVCVEEEESSKRRRLVAACGGGGGLQPCVRGGPPPLSLFVCVLQMRESVPKSGTMAAASVCDTVWDSHCLTEKKATRDDVVWVMRVPRWQERGRGGREKGL